MILTIAIPTYNRPELLKKTIASIAGQIVGNSDISINILDDSVDGINREVFELYRDSFPGVDIRYTINESNLGIDENIKRCIISASSEYVWLLGEDDLIVDGAIENIIPILQRNEYPFIFVNYIYCNNSHTRFSAGPVVEAGVAGEMLFNDFAKKWIWAIGFIGGCIVRRVDWCSQNYGKYHGTYYSHVGGIIDSSIFRKIYVESSISVLNRAEDSGTFTWSKNTFDVYLSFYDVLRKSRISEFPDFFHEIELSASKLFPVDSLVWLLAKRADGIFDIESFKKYYLSRDGISFSKKIVFAMAAIFPRGPLKLIRKIHLRRRFSSASYK